MASRSAVAITVPLSLVEKVEAGWQKAIDKIGERAGLTKGPTGHGAILQWSEAA